MSISDTDIMWLCDDCEAFGFVEVSDVYATMTRAEDQHREIMPECDFLHGRECRIFPVVRQVSACTSI